MVREDLRGRKTRLASLLGCWLVLQLAAFVGGVCGCAGEEKWHWTLMESTGGNDRTNIKESVTYINNHMRWKEMHPVVAKFWHSTCNHLSRLQFDEGLCSVICK